MAKSEKDFKAALQNKNVPILTLDHKWHQLFGQSRQTDTLVELEDAVNDLLKQQGKMNTELKKVRSLKKKLMDEIVTLADQLNEDPGNKSLEKEMDDHKRLMAECDEKSENLKEEGMDIPKELNEANRALMLETMKLCYERFDENTAEMDEIGEWIRSIKAELKQKIVKRQDRELDNYNLYLYMHDIFGSDVMKLFEMSYNPSEHPPKKADS